MIRPAENHPTLLNNAALGADRNRSAYGGVGFAAINAMFAPARSPREAVDTLNIAPVPGDRMLADLNTLNLSPRLAAAIASVNAADDAHQSQQQSESEDARQAELRRNAQKLVSQTFFGPMLRQMRNSPFKSDLFSGGRGGDVFNSLFDQHIADRMAAGTNNRLVAAVVRHLEKLGKPAPVVPGAFENVRTHVAPDPGS